MGSKGLFSGFQKQRFGIFQAAVSQWLGHKTCCGSAFSHARPKHVFHGFCLVACGLSSLTLRRGLPCLRQLFFFVFSIPKATFRHFSGCGFAWLGHYFFVFSGFQKRRFGIFPAAVSHGLGTKPAGVLLFRMRVPNTFFLSLAWWLAGFQVLRCAKVCLAVSHGLGTISLFLVGSKSDVSAFFWLRFRMAWALFLCF